MWMLWLFTLVLFLPHLLASNIGGTRQDILQNDNGGYENILVAISRAVPEDLNLLHKVQVCSWGEKAINCTALGKKSLGTFNSQTKIVKRELLFYKLHIICAFQVFQS